MNYLFILLEVRLNFYFSLCTDVQLSRVPSTIYSSSKYWLLVANKVNYNQVRHFLIYDQVHGLLLGELTMTNSVEWI